MEFGGQFVIEPDTPEACDVDVQSSEAVHLGERLPQPGGGVGRGPLRQRLFEPIRAEFLLPSV